MKLVKSATLLLLCASVFAQPVKVEYTCSPGDVDSFGFSCSPEEPCSVLLELSSVEAVGARLFVAGNLHTASTTMYGILLSSEDGGKSWTEPLKRLRASAFEQVQFLDLSTGWISGESIDPLPRDPFLLITTDGGANWRQKPLLEESRSGFVAQFWFDSPTTGELVLDRRHAGGTTHEIYQTKTGGESWEMKESSTKPVTLKGRKENSWRLRADGKIYHLERRGPAAWEPVTSFSILVAECK
jgi:photosystem II stability/assembly factor-like uncharacterized protein